MNRNRLIWLLLLLGGLSLAPAADPPLACYVQLIRGTDDTKPRDPAHKEIGPMLDKRLRPVFRWAHYWENQREQIALIPGKPSKVHLKNGRDLEVEWLKGGQIQVRVFRDNQLTRKVTHRNTVDMMAILGSEKDDESSWFVVVRRSKPQDPEL
jgi:hypothetical protein